MVLSIIALDMLAVIVEVIVLCGLAGALGVIGKKIYTTIKLKRTLKTPE